MIINVTQEHIDAGETKNCWACPVALALRDVIHGAAAVTNTLIKIRKQGETFSSGLMVQSPMSVFHFVTKFDAGITPPPFSFELNIPTRLLK